MRAPYIDAETTAAAPKSVANPERSGLKKGLYLIPSAFTATNIGMGFYAVMSALRGFQYIGIGAADLTRAATHFDNAAKAICWAVLFDTLDGRLARMTKTTTEIGVQFDSIADVLTFGIAPAVLAYAWGYGAALNEAGAAYSIGWFLSFMFLMCGAFRLARFNVQAARPRVLAEGAAKLDKKSFVGLPIPAAAALIASVIHFSPQPLVGYEPVKAEFYSGLMMVLVGCLSVLMVSTLRYTSFKNVGTTKRNARAIILLIAAAGMLMWLFSRHVLLIMWAVYAAHGVLARLAGLLRKRPAAI